MTGTTVFPGYLQSLLKEKVQSLSNRRGCIPGGADRKGPRWFGIQAFHCNANQFTRNADTPPEKRELRDPFCHRIAGMGKELGGDRQELGDGHGGSALDPLSGDPYNGLCSRLFPGP